MRMVSPLVIGRFGLGTYCVDYHLKVCFTLLAGEEKEARLQMIIPSHD